MLNWPHVFLFHVAIAPGMLIADRRHLTVSHKQGLLNAAEAPALFILSLQKAADLGDWPVQRLSRELVEALFLKNDYLKAGYRPNEDDTGVKRSDGSVHR